jgi:hypothetical protein
MTAWHCLRQLQLRHNTHIMKTLKLDKNSKYFQFLTAGKLYLLFSMITYRVILKSLTHLLLVISSKSLAAQNFFWCQNEEEE